MARRTSSHRHGRSPVGSCQEISMVGRASVAPAASPSTAASAIEVTVTADNWGGLFDGGDAGDGADLLAPSASTFVTPTTAPSAVTLTTGFVVHAEQEWCVATAHVLDERVPDLSGLGTSSAHLVVNTPMPLSARVPTTEHIDSAQRGHPVDPDPDPNPNPDDVAWCAEHGIPPLLDAEYSTGDPSPFTTIVSDLFSTFQSRGIRDAVDLAALPHARTIGRVICPFFQDCVDTQGGDFARKHQADCARDVPIAAQTQCSTKCQLADTGVMESAHVAELSQHHHRCLHFTVSLPRASPCSLPSPWSIPTWVHSSLATASACSAIGTSANYMAGFLLDITKVSSCEGTHWRYTSNPASINTPYSIGVFLPCHAIDVLEVHMGIESVVIHGAMMLQPLSENMVDKGPWPPPLPFVLQGDRDLIRPTPWPSFHVGEKRSEIATGSILLKPSCVSFGHMQIIDWYFVGKIIIGNMSPGAYTSGEFAVVIAEDSFRCASCA